MAIQEEMYKLIEKEIDDTLNIGKEIRTVDIDKAKKVAKMLASLSTDANEPDNLISQYIVNIKNICNE